jgi:transposase
MFSRHDPSGAHWERIRRPLPGQPGGHGGVGDDTRRFVSVIRSLARTGLPKADLPTAVGKSNSLWQRYSLVPFLAVWRTAAAGAGLQRPPVAIFHKLGCSPADSSVMVGGRSRLRPE